MEYERKREREREKKVLRGAIDAKQVNYFNGRAEERPNKGILFVRLKKDKYVVSSAARSKSYIVF